MTTTTREERGTRGGRRGREQPRPPERIEAGRKRTRGRIERRDEARPGDAWGRSSGREGGPAPRTGRAFVLRPASANGDSVTTSRANEAKRTNAARVASPSLRWWRRRRRPGAEGGGGRFLADPGRAHRWDPPLYLAPHFPTVLWGSVRVWGVSVVVDPPEIAVWGRVAAGMGRDCGVWGCAKWPIPRGCHIERGCGLGGAERDGRCREAFGMSPSLRHGWRGEHPLGNPRRHQPQRRPSGHGAPRGAPTAGGWSISQASRRRPTGASGAVRRRPPRGRRGRFAGTPIRSSGR